MKYWFQIHTGNVYENSTLDMKRIIGTLDDFYRRGQLSGVFAGWGADPAVYHQLAEKLKTWNVPFYFKTAVFSEIEEAPKLLGSPEIDYEPMVGPDLQPSKPYHLNDQENFLFRCPSSKRNRRISIDFVLHFLDEGIFDGVFLDRIRYNSLISGVDGIGCFCPRCLQIYRERSIDTEKVRTRLLDIAEKGTRLPAVYEDGVYTFGDPDLDAFFRTRADMIKETVREFAAEMRERGKIIGLDLFTPSAAYFTGQDVLGLSKEVDFIKPMLYQFTKAPAGIPFEMPYVYRFVELEEAAQGGKEQAQDKNEQSEPSIHDVFLKDLTLLKKAACSVYTGVEINQIDPICLSTVEELGRTLSEIREAGMNEIVCSWDLEQMPETHLDVLRSFAE